MNPKLHPHPIKKKEGKPFECSGCKELGFGPRYQCVENCDFVLHEDCFKARPTDQPKTHPFMGRCRFQFLHAPPGGQYRRFCDACGRDVRGFLYHDIDKHKLDLHPYCMSLKNTMNDPFGRMVLKLKDKMPSKCVICERKDIEEVKSKEPFRGWSYVSSCGKYSYHVYCVKKLIYDNWERGHFNVASSSSTKSSSRGRSMSKDVSTASSSTSTIISGKATSMSSTAGSSTSTTRCGKGTSMPSTARSSASTTRSGKGTSMPSTARSSASTTRSGKGASMLSTTRSSTTRSGKGTSMSSTARSSTTRSGKATSMPSTARSSTSTTRSGKGTSMPSSARSSSTRTTRSGTGTSMSSTTRSCTSTTRSGKGITMVNTASSSASAVTRSEQGVRSSITPSTTSSLSVPTRKKPSSFTRVLIKIARVGFSVILSVLFGHPTPLIAALAECLLDT